MRIQSAIGSACRVCQLLLVLILLGYWQLTPAKANSKSQMRSQLASMTQDMPVRGVIRSSHQADISTDLPARITGIAYKEGEQFFKHDLLLTLDCKRFQAEWESAKALQREMALALKSAKFLYKQQAGSTHKVETAKARLDRAQADVKAMSSRVDQCEIRAPFDGRVSKLHVNEHETPIPGRPIISILANQDPTLELIVPSSWLSWLKVGMKFEFNIDETQTTHGCEVKRIGASVDSVSQTIKIYAGFAQTASNILPGMSGTAKFAWNVGGK